MRKKSIHVFCILSAKYIKNKQLVFLLTTLLLILNAMNIAAIPGNDISQTSATQPVTITGTVTDEANVPLAGVYVMIEGTNTGVITDVDGKYSIQVPGLNVSLQYSYIGYLTKTIAIAGQSVINVVLVEDVTALEEVVVIGYGTARKSDITGSITSVNVDRLRDVPASSIVKSLQGKTAGVEIQNIGRTPGANSQIRIRGNRSLSGSNDPLVIVDGIPFGGSINDIASDDIAGIEVLKDASATAIYGSRGSNGVIIITTKKGEQGKIKVGYNGYYGLTDVARKYDVMNAEEFIKLRSVANYTNYLPDERESMLLGRDVDWQDLVYQTGETHDHQLNFSGGAEKFQYSLSGGYFKETGVIPLITYQRYNVRMAIDQQIGNRIKLGVTTMNSIGKNKDTQASRMMWATYSLSPLMVPYEKDGTLNLQPAYDTDNTYNPLSFLDHTNWGDESRRVTSFNTLYFELTLLKGLKYRANIGYDFSTTKGNTYAGSETEMLQGRQSEGTTTNSDNQAYTVENLLIYENTFGNHRIGFTGMQSVQESVSTASNFKGTTLAADYVQWNDFRMFETVDADGTNNYYRKWNIMSFMGRINYAFKDRYLLTITGRHDGSSRLAEGRKWETYPAIALGWKIKEESFMQGLTAISTLKLRAGYGKTANTAIDPYATLGGLSSTVYSFGDRGVSGYYVSSLPNTKLTWETTGQTNIGLDFGFLNDRINGSVDAYMQKTEDVLLAVSLPASQGVPGSYWTNIGSTENKGLEIVLNGVILPSRGRNSFSWELNTNIFFNREKITALQDKDITQDIGNGWFVGHPSSAIYDYEKIGIWQLGEEVEAAVYEAKPGDIKFKDQITVDTDGDGIADAADGRINDADRIVLGSSQPDFMGGFTSTWKYRGFDLSVVAYFRVGGMIASTLHMPNNYWNRLDGRRGGIKVDYWTETNPTNDMPKPNVTINAARTNVLGYFDGSFLKIRSINLGYNVDQKFTNWMGQGSSVRVYASVTDPFIFFSPYLKAGGLDPDPTNTASTDNNALAMPQRTLVVSGGQPPVRKLIFGLNVRF